jgi:hypothetical protein
MDEISDEQREGLEKGTQILLEAGVVIPKQTDNPDEINFEINPVFFDRFKRVCLLDKEIKTFDEALIKAFFKSLGRDSPTKSVTASEEDMMIAFRIIEALVDPEGELRGIFEIETID